MFMRRFQSASLPCFSALLLAACASTTTAPPSPPPSPAAQQIQPEAASGFQAKQAVSAQRFMVAAANPLATEAGYDILKAGGSAVDAAIAVQMVLTLVEPQSSGTGGGAFLLHFDGRQKVAAWDGRETAPAGVDDKLFIGADGKPLAFLAAAVGGRAVGVPGAVRMLEEVHRQHGTLPWARLFEPAIRLAEQGFALSPRLHTQLLADGAHLAADPVARAYFFGADGQPHPVGHVLRNPALAQVLARVAQGGSAVLHNGPIAQDIARRVQSHPANPGKLTAQDLAAYAPREREPICTPWRMRYRVCGMPPPSSGHLAVMQILGMLEHQPAVAGLQAGAPSADFVHLYSEAARLAFADRAQYVADPDFVAPPAGRWASLLDEAYLKQRAALIGPMSMKTAQPGVPGGAATAFAPQASQIEFGTSHISVVDAQGRAVAMTTSIEAVFGARLMSDGGTGLAGGFVLNNQLTDFSFAPTGADGRPVANRVQPGKRPRSSMSPTLVFDARDGRLLMSLGSPGGAAIIHFTAKTLIGTLAWGLNPQAAIDLPNFGSFNGPTVLEKGRHDPGLVQALQARGHTVNETDMTSGLQAILRTPAGWQGGADPRREGVVRGD
jgi:gamma-glutamyltranspeptidase / glutathione hydrolase